MNSISKYLFIVTSIIFLSTTTFASEEIIVINPIIVPEGKEIKALEIWDRYAEYFKKQPGYIGTKLHKTIDPEAKFHYINVATWRTSDDFINALNNDEIKKIGNGFPKEMPHFPSMYQVIRN